MVNLLFENAKKNQWRDVKIYTYKQILYHLSHIAAYFLEGLINKSDSNYDSLNISVQTIVNGFTHPNKDTVEGTAAAYRDLSSKLREIIRKKETELESLENRQLDELSQYVSNMDIDFSRSLEPIRLILIPRMVMLSAPQKNM